MNKPVSPPPFAVRIVQSMPCMMQILCVCIVAAYVVWAMGGDSLRLTILAQGGLQPLAFMPGEDFNMARAMSGAFGHIFIHASFGHLAVNLAALVLASGLLTQLAPQSWRGGRQLILYIGGVIVGAATHIIIAEPQTLMIGASVGVAGLWGGLLYQYTAGLSETLLRRCIASVALISMTMGATTTSPAISHLANWPHLVGFLFGAWIFPYLSVILLFRERKQISPDKIKGESYYED